MFTRVSFITLLIIASMSMALSMEISMEKDKPATVHKPDPKHPVEDPEHKEKQGKFYFAEIRETWDNLVCKIGFCTNEEAEAAAVAVAEDKSSNSTAPPTTVKPAEKPAETTPKPVETTHKPAK